MLVDNFFEDTKHVIVTNFDLDRIKRLNDLGDLKCKWKRVKKKVTILT